MRIQHNIMAMNAYRNYSNNTSALSKNLERLSSGYKINRAGDDAAGLAISEKMRMNITENERCQANVQEGLDLARTADGALAEINDMLCRAKSLCVQAANDTYDEQERAEISKELNALFEEIDRISEGSRYNTIQLFRSNEPESEPPPILPPPFHYEYVESIEPTEELQVWGEMEFLEPGYFDRAEPAKVAQVSFQLDESIDLDDVSTLEGKSLRIGEKSYYFTQNTSIAPSSDSNSYSYTKLNLRGITTVEDALKLLVTKSPDIGSVEIDKATRTVTLSSVRAELLDTVIDRGEEKKQLIPSGDGESKNGILVNQTTGSSSIGQIDGEGVMNNQPIYSDTLTLEYTLPAFTGGLDYGHVTNLKENSLQISVNGLPSKSIALSAINPTVGMTRDQIGQKLVDEINKNPSMGSNGICTAAYSDGKLSLTVKKSSGSYSGYASVNEITKTISGGNTSYGPSWTATALNISSVSTPGTAEKGAEMAITVPVPSGPFGLKIGNTNYLFYDSTTNPLTSGEYNQVSTSPYVSSTYQINTRGKSPTEIQKQVLRLVENHAKSLSSNHIESVTVSGNTIKIKAYPSAPINASVSGMDVSVRSYKYTPSVGTSRILMTKTEYFSQDLTIPFSLGSDIGALAGKGFSIGSRKIEFTNGGNGLSSLYPDIDISGMANFEDVKNAVQNALGNSFTVTLDTSNPQNVKMNISQSRETDYNTLRITDGDGGLMMEDQVEFSGGTMAGHSQKTIDFSSINKDNLNTLLGKGFRIHCASCSGEYINIFFCLNDNGTILKSFERMDAENGEMRTIYNIPVELSKVTDGNRIVESIVSQVRPLLNHLTDVSVGEDPATLIAMEKRMGDVELNGAIYLGRLQTGVETNFVYHVETVKVEDPVEPPEEPEIPVRENKIGIYTGSDSDEPYIYIRLPHIDSKWLDLYAGEVDLTSQDPLELLERVDKANIAIAKARGEIGADYNRLEHTWQNLSQTEIQLTDAESCIRDADIAELMMENTKIQILLQSQQSMLAQANQVPQGVLQLLQ